MTPRERTLIVEQYQSLAMDNTLTCSILPLLCSLACFSSLIVCVSRYITNCVSWGHIFLIYCCISTPNCLWELFRTCYTLEELVKCTLINSIVYKFFQPSFFILLTLEIIVSPSNFRTVWFHHAFSVLKQKRST